MEPTGLQATVSHTVTAADTALAVGSGDVEVLATPRLLALAEAATVAALAGHLEPSETSVGSRVQLEHLRASPVGALLRVHARLGHADGRLLRFDVAAEHADGTVVASGQITRVLVDARRFRMRVEAQMTGEPAVTGDQGVTSEQPAADDDLRFEILLPRPIDAAWLAFRDPVVIRRWYGWEYPGLGPEIKPIFVDTTLANKPARTLHIGGHLFTFATRDDHTHVRVTRAEPIRSPADDVDWDVFYDVIEEGWITFLQQLRFMMARHPKDARRTVFRVGGARSGVPTPLGDLIGLSDAARTPAGEPYQADVGPGDHLEGEVWFRTALQLGVTVDAWGDGLLILAHMPGTPEPFMAASMTLTTFGLDEAAFADLEARWDEWWNKRYEIPELED